MGRLGSHPHIVTMFDLGQEAGQPYMVTELMGGGDVEGVIEDAPDNGFRWNKPSTLPRRPVVGWSSPTAGASCTET